ncbi:hypothetical protein QL285_087946 [Trifolium repens]|nr:hypothetical protein QL285_087946 [Trifolium repens]
MISDPFRNASVPSVSVSTCLVVVCSVPVFGSEFSVAVVFQRRRWWGWCYWFTRFSSVFCLLRSWSGFVFRLPRRIGFCYWFKYLGGDSDDSEMEVMRGVVVATNLSWVCWWRLRWI